MRVLQMAEARYTLAEGPQRRGGPGAGGAVEAGGGQRPWAWLHRTADMERRDRRSKERPVGLVMGPWELC